MAKGEQKGNREAKQQKRKGQNDSGSTRAKKARLWVGNQTSDQARRKKSGASETFHMEDHAYKVLELVGSSEESIEDAIQNAITPGVENSS